MEQQCNKMKVGGSTIVCQAPLLIRQEILVIKTSFSHIIVKLFCINILATILTYHVAETQTFNEKHIWN